MSLSNNTHIRIANCGNTLVVDRSPWVQPAGLPLNFEDFATWNPIKELLGSWLLNNPGPRGELTPLESYPSWNVVEASVIRSSSCLSQG